MTFLQVVNIIRDTALAQPNVNTVVREFLDLNREDTVYSAVVIQDRDGSRDRIVEQDWNTYTFHLGYVDRLTDDEKNRDDIFSTGINVINNIVASIRERWDLGVSIIDRFSTFNQRFTAQCAGVYVVLAIQVPVSDCIDSESTDLYDTYDAKITANGVYHFVPSGRPVDEINITVDVAGSGKEEVSLTDTLTMNGTHTYIPEENTVYKDVELTVDVHPTERLVQTYTTNGVKTITGEFNGGEITVDVDTDAVWGSITGNITNQTDLVDYVTGKDNDIKTWVSEQGYLTSLSLNGYATESWVTSQGYITSIPDTYATKDWVSSQGYLTEHQDLSSYALKSEIPSLDGYATESWVESKGYVTVETLPEGIATQEWVTNQGYITSIPDTFATKTWVSSQGYLTEHQDLSSYALKSEIPSLTGYATQSWVQSQGYLTSHQDLSSYATKSWATSQFFEESKIWTGTQSAWDALTSSQKASYTIALITE